MKHTLKKILAVILAAATLLCCAPLSGLAEIDLPDISKFFVSKAKAVEASDLPEDFDLPLYNVSRIFSDSNNVGGSLKTFSENFINLSLAKKVYNAAAENAGFVASIEAWEAIRLVSNPSNLAEYLKYQQQYEEVIFAVLFSALKNEKFEEFSYSNGISKITSLTNKIITSGKNAELLDKTSLDGTERKELIDTAFAFLTEGKDVESKWSALGEYTDIVNKYNSIVDDIAEGIVSAINIIDSVSMYVSMLDAGAEVLSYLNALKAKAPNSVFGGAVQTVINTISKEWLGVVEKTIIDVGFVFGIPATEKLIDYAWTGCSAMCPFLGGMTIGEAAGTIACNLLFATEDTIEQYEYLKILTQLETAACALYDGYFNSCKSSVNRENAAMLMFACDFSHALYGVATEASVEMMNILCNKGIVNTVINIFNNKYKQTFDEFEEASNTLLNAEKNVYNMIKSFWKTCIEEDYPEYFGVLEEENITPKYINSVDIEKDEVVFRVGDAMYFKWNINPINHEGEIGLKSDNEAVIKSREPMGILPLALEENIGTANVTIYSVDNPEIYDTIKITVIGEDDEGITEAEQNIVSGNIEGMTWTFNQNTGRLVINGTGYMKLRWFYNSYVAPWFEYTHKIKNVSISEGITNIAPNAFYGASQLKKIVIPNSVTNIGDSAFDYCDNLSNVVMSKNITKIGDLAFARCFSLTNITIPNSVTYIGDSAFIGCSFTSITIPQSIKSLGESVFNGCTKLETFNYNAQSCSVPIPGQNIYPVIRYCTNLKYVNIGESVNEIPTWLFRGVNSIERVTIANGVTDISYCAFAGCENLTEITIPDSVTSIHSGAFAGCENLTKITIPDSVTNIGEYAFRNCKNLREVTIPKGVKYIGLGVFWDCSKLETLCFDAENCSVQDHGQDLPLFYGCSNLKNVYFGENVDVIPEFLLHENNSVEKIEISNGISSISEYAFYSCHSLIYIIIPESVTVIERGAFDDCRNLENIIIPQSVTSIGDYAFCNCDSLVSVTFPDNMSVIGSGVFYGCDNLKSITIPNTVTTIGDRLVENCVNFTDVYYIGTKIEWNKIEIKGYNLKLRTANIHFNPKDHIHSYNSSITTTASCLDNGILTYTCDCGDSYTESIPVTDHTAGSWQTILKPTTETTGKKIKKCTVCGETLAEETIAKLPKEPVKDNTVVSSPSTATISYGDSILLHVDASKIPEGGRVEWTASNNNFSWSADGDTCKISPKSSGDTTFTATIYDAEGNPVSIDEQTMTSKAGFFDKIIAFFKSLFGLTKTYENVYKGIIR